MKTKVHINIRITPELAAILKEEVDARDVSVTKVVEEAIQERYFDKAIRKNIKVA